MPTRPELLSAGDLIGFSAHDALGAAINLATWGVPWWSLSHVGIVAAHPNPALRGLPLLWESTALLDRPCILQNERVAGVQAHLLRRRIEGYRGKVWHYPLARPLIEAQGRRLTDFLSAQLGKGYDAIGAFRCRSAGFGWLERRLWPENLHSLFCSELVGAAWRECGAWSVENASAWSPNRLARAALKMGIVEKPVRLK